MTLQEIYQTSATRLLEQNRKSISADGTCLYRSYDGACCAVGLLFQGAPWIYSMIEQGNLNGVSAGRLLSRLPAVREFFGIPAKEDLLRDRSGLSQETIRKMGLLWRLQEVHDTTNSDQWPGLLRTVGQSFDLDTSFLN